jgi:hypothetical protein
MWIRLPREEGPPSVFGFNVIRAPTTELWGYNRRHEGCPKICPEVTIQYANMGRPVIDTRKAGQFCSRDVAEQRRSLTLVDRSSSFIV